MEKLKIKVVDFLGTIAMYLMINLQDIIETIVTLAVTVVVTLIITHYFFMPVRVVGTSMVPTLKDNGLGFASVISKNISEIERFDIVVIKVDNENERIVKRVIGLPGESIWCSNDTIYIDGKPIEQSFLDDEYVKSQLEMAHIDFFTNDFDVVTLGENEYFCLGDNRIVSSDSRYYGPFTKDDIVAVGVFIIYPFK